MFFIARAVAPTLPALRGRTRTTRILSSDIVSERYHTAAKMGKKACSSTERRAGAGDARDMDDSLGHLGLRSRSFASRAARSADIMPWI
jgi:hypothetical protein